MSSEPRPAHSDARSRRSLRRILLGGIAVVVVIAGLYLYDYIRINLWIDRDAGQLEGYPVRLIEEGKEVAHSADEHEQQISRLLIAKMREGQRNVVTLSRSEIKYNLLRTRAYVKGFLETALPDRPEPRSRLKFSQRFRRASQGWQLDGEPAETTLE